MAKTKSQYLSEARQLLGEVYVTELISDQFLLTQANNAAAIIGAFNGGRWDFLIKTEITPVTSSTEEIDVPDDFYGVERLSIGSEESSATEYLYVVPSQYYGNPQQYTIEGGKIIFPAVTSGNIYLKYYRNIEQLLASQDLTYLNLSPELELAIVNYMVGMGFRKKRQFNNANEYIGVMTNNRTNQYPNSFYGILERFGKNHIMSKGKSIINKRPNLTYV